MIVEIQTVGQQKWKRKLEEKTMIKNRVPYNEDDSGFIIRDSLTITQHKKSRSLHIRRLVSHTEHESKKSLLSTESVELMYG